MRGIGGDEYVYKLLQYDQKTQLIKEDQNYEEKHKDDEEYNHSNCYDDDHTNINDEHEPFSVIDDQEEDSMDRTMYWDSQEALLEEILEQYKLNGSKLRDELHRLIELGRKTKFCECNIGSNLDGCSNCLRRKVVNLLCKKGFNASLCTSIWKKKHSIPAGKHEYIEVIASSLGKKRKIKFLIEIEFREEFKMAKACNEYRKLMEQIPETYIGKPEHLNAILRVMCDAAKRSAAEKKIHLGPWRKMSFMQLKWSASSTTTTTTTTTQLGLKQED